MPKRAIVTQRHYDSYRALERQILETARHYARLTVRQLYYILVSKYGYAPSRKFYKSLDWHLTKLRRMEAYRGLHEKFIDPTRHFIVAPMPYHAIEIFVEKDSIRNFIGDLAAIHTFPTKLTHI